LLLLLSTSATALLSGKTAQQGDYPYALSLQRYGAHICNGVLLSARTALTAAHCVTAGQGIETYPARSFQVRVGSPQRSAGGVLAQVESFVVHRSYAGGLNDLALVQLQQPLTLTPQIQPIAVAKQAPATDSALSYVGWGSTAAQSSALSQSLQSGSLKTVSAADCEKQLYLADAGLLCLASAKDQGMCLGDAGAPAVFDKQLVGIGAFYVQGCDSTLPNGFMSVAHYSEWIETHIR
ncbi:CG4653, partial [Drosophila busckii]